jgi:hypothetical protein
MIFGYNESGNRGAVDNADQFLLIPAAAPHRIGKADGCCYRQDQNENEKKVIHSVIA